jgi:hypothetical protein
MAKGCMRDLVSHDTGQFSFITGGHDRSRVNEKEAAGQGVSIDREGRHDLKLIWESFAGSSRSGE